MVQVSVIRNLNPLGPIRSAKNIGALAVDTCDIAIGYCAPCVLVLAEYAWVKRAGRLNYIET